MGKEPGLEIQLGRCAHKVAALYEIQLMEDMFRVSCMDSLYCVYIQYLVCMQFSLSARLMPGHFRQIAVISVKIISLLLFILPVNVLQRSLVCNTFLLYASMIQICII